MDITLNELLKDHDSFLRLESAEVGKLIIADLIKSEKSGRRSGDLNQGNYLRQYMSYPIQIKRKLQKDGNG
jgi:hypothetical protein